MNPCFSSHRLTFSPERVHLLTEEEYNQEGQEETRRALEDLREYCHSPQCNVWHTLSRLSSSSRFIEFVAGGSHVSDAEKEDHSLFLESEDFLPQMHNPSNSDLDDNESVRSTSSPA